MRKITTILFTALFSTSALAAFPAVTFINSAPTVKTAPLPPKKPVLDTKKWLPPLEIQNKKK